MPRLCLGQLHFSNAAIHAAIRQQHSSSRQAVTKRTAVVADAAVAERPIEPVPARGVKRSSKH